MDSNQSILKPICALCKKEINFVEGDVIFGEKWYHKDCAHLYRFKHLISH